MKDDNEYEKLNSNKTTKIFLDTNVLMSHSSQLFNKYKDNPNTKFIICGFVLNELDNHKMSFDESKKYKARQASRDIEANQDKIEYVVRENNFEYNLPISFDNLSRAVFSPLIKSAIKRTLTSGYLSLCKSAFSKIAIYGSIFEKMSSNF